MFEWTHNVQRMMQGRELPLELGVLRQKSCLQWGCFAPVFVSSLIIMSARHRGLYAPHHNNHDVWGGIMKRFILFLIRKHGTSNINLHPCSECKTNIYLSFQSHWSDKLWTILFDVSVSMFCFMFVWRLVLWIPVTWEGLCVWKFCVWCLCAFVLFYVCVEIGFVDTCDLRGALCMKILCLMFVCVCFVLCLCGDWFCGYLCSVTWEGVCVGLWSVRLCNYEHIWFSWGDPMWLTGRC